MKTGSQCCWGLADWRRSSVFTLTPVWCLRDSMEAGDPGGPVQLEVERGVKGLVEQHTAWLELLASSHKGEEYDWRTAELLSCLRAIEVRTALCGPAPPLCSRVDFHRGAMDVWQWDLQDLEDAVSIVEGNREKFVTLDDDAVKARRDFIETIRTKIDDVRASVQEASMSEGGHGGVKRPKAALPSMAAAQGYGKLAKEGNDGVAGESRTLSAGAADQDYADRLEVERLGRRRRLWWACCC
jgi:hypothetical protein